MKTKDIFRRAYMNEIYADSVFNEKSQIKEVLGFNMIKPYKIKGKIAKKSKRYLFLFFTVRVFWPILNFLWSSVQFFRGISKLLTVPRVSLSSNLFLNYSGR